jgi:uncharacterized protein
MLTPEEIQTVTSFLDERFGLDTLWLFGSEARGTARSESDVDFGGLFRRRPTPLEVFDAGADLGLRLNRRVDLVDLDRASPILGMQVLRHGRLLVDRNPKRRHAFFGQTLSQYEDVKIVRREIESALYERMGRGRA